MHEKLYNHCFLRPGNSIIRVKSNGDKTILPKAKDTIGNVLPIPSYYAPTSIAMILHEAVVRMCRQALEWESEHARARE